MNEERLFRVAVLLVLIFCGAMSFNMMVSVTASTEKNNRLTEEAQIMEVSWDHCVQGQAKPLRIVATGSDVTTFEANLAYLENKFPNNCP